jgi:hypothetical protein
MFYIDIIADKKVTSSCVAAVVFDSDGGWALLFLFLLVLEKSSVVARSNDEMQE